MLSSEHLRGTGRCYLAKNLPSDFPSSFQHRISDLPALRSFPLPPSALFSPPLPRSFSTKLPPIFPDRKTLKTPSTPASTSFARRASQSTPPKSRSSFRSQGRRNFSSWKPSGRGSSLPPSLSKTFSLRGRLGRWRESSPTCRSILTCPVSLALDASCRRFLR